MFVIAAVVQGTAGCGEIPTDAFSKWEQMREAYRDRRIRNDEAMRRKMAAGAFGRDQLLPASNFKSPARFGGPPKFPFNETVMRLPSLTGVPVATLDSPIVIEIRRGDRSTGSGSSVAAGGGGGGAGRGPCVYKSVMTAEDIAACR